MQPDYLVLARVSDGQRRHLGKHLGKAGRVLGYRKSDDKFSLCFDEKPEETWWIGSQYLETPTVTEIAVVRRESSGQTSGDA